MGDAVDLVGQSEEVGLEVLGLPVVAERQAFQRTVVAFQDQDPGILVEPGTEITVKIGRLDSDFGCTWTENPS